MKPIFTPEDFETAPTVLADRYKAAEIANAKINKLIESAPTVHGLENYLLWRTYREDPDTHKARLMFIEEIEKEECKHEARSYTTTLVSNGEIKFRCCKCNIELVAEWKPRNTSEGL